MQLRFNNRENKHFIACKTLYFSSVVFLKGDAKHAILNLYWRTNEEKGITENVAKVFLNGFIDLYTPSEIGTLLLRKDNPRGLFKFPRLVGEISMSFQNSPNASVEVDFDVIVELFTNN